MDGVLVDTNPHHKTAWREYYQKNGKTLSDADFVQYVSGRHNKDIVAHLFGGQTLTPEEVHRLGNEKESLFRELYRPVITPVSGPDSLFAITERSWYQAGGSHIRPSRKP